MRRALISGMTSGTPGSMRNADELSTTTAPAFTAIGAKFLEMPLPAENSAISTPLNEVAPSSSISMLSPRKLIVLPAERALASAFSLPTRNPRLSMAAMNSAPTAPVTPAMATTGSFFTFGLHQAKKSSRPLQAGASGSDDAIVRYARTPPEAPEGLPVFAVRLVFVIMARELMRGLDARQPPSTYFRTTSQTGTGFNEVESGIVVTQ